MTPGHTHRNIFVVFTPAKSETDAIKTGRIIERASKISWHSLCTTAGHLKILLAMP
jgi:hypothetical protein